MKTTQSTQQLEALLHIISTVDTQLEEAILYKWPVKKTLDMLLPKALNLLEAQAIMVRTFDETSEQVDFIAPTQTPLSSLLSPDEIDALCDTIQTQNTALLHLDQHLVLGYRLDVSTTYLGAVVLVYHDKDASSDDVHHLEKRLLYWSEALDNYLAAVADARRKHTALQQLSDALRTPILDRGIDDAITTLKNYLPFSDLILTLKYEANLDLDTINYRIITADQTVHSSASSSPRSDQHQQAILNTFDGTHDELVKFYNLNASRTTINILDAHDQAIVGHISIHAEHHNLTPFALDLLDRFADYIRQRIVDFNKEWKHLARNFPLATVRRLLQHEDYNQRFLSARERNVTIMYCDISGFTKLSEQILKEPALIGKLIDIWSSQVVEFIWDSGGVFDKMVGDCIIGLWGPPFYERSPEEDCAAALDASQKIQTYTNNLLSHPELPELHGKDIEIGVATGLNHCSLFVGTFGPDDNFTGFSSGMNNTARLQGVATRNEILCMDSFVHTLNTPERFGDELLAQVKNVEHPIKYRKIL